MKLIKVLAFVLTLALLGVSMLALSPIAPTFATPPSPIYFSVEPTPNPPLTNQNTTIGPDGNIHQLETLGGASTPVAQYFNVTIYLRNATVTNVETQTNVGYNLNATGVWGVEVHFNFSAIAHASDGSRVCTPIAYFNMLGQTGGVLTADTHHGLVYGIAAGFYDSSGNPVSAPGLATQYEVAAATTLGPWNGTVGTVAVIEFEIMGAPSISLGQSSFTQSMTISYADLRATIPPAPPYIYSIFVAVPFYIINGSLKIDATTSQTYDSAAIAVVSPIYKYSAALYYTCIVNATVANYASVTAAFNVELIFNSTGTVGTGYVVGMGTVQSLATSTQLNVSIYGYTSIIGFYGYNNVSIYTEPVLGEPAGSLANNGPVTLPTQNWKKGYYVMITIPGDFNEDQHADLTDLSVLAACYNAPTSGKKYNPNCDVKDDGSDSLTDLSLLAGHYNYPGGTDNGWTNSTY